MTKIIFYLAFIVVSLFSNLYAQTKIEKLFYSGDFKSACELLKTKIENGNALASDYQMAAQCNAQMFDYQSAIVNFERALSFDSTNISIREAIADTKVNLGYKKDALQTYSEILAVDTLNVRVSAKKADLLLDLNKHAEAESIYQELYNSDSTNTFYLRRLMLSKYKQKNYAYVIGLYENNPYLPTDDNDVFMMAADAYHKVNNHTKALDILYNIVANDSLYIPAISKIAYIYFSSFRNYEDAVIYYRKLNELEDYSDPFHLKNLGICEYFTYNYEYSAPLLDSLTKEINDDPFISFYAGLS